MISNKPILRIESLGGNGAIAAQSDGVERRLGRGKPTALLTYLAAIPGRRASREHLAALLWADGGPDAGRQNVRQTLWYLRKRLGDGLVSATDDQIALTCKVEFDRDSFLEAAQRRDLETAVAAYHGPFLPEFAAPGAAEFEQWADLERRRLVATFLRCADTLSREWLRAGRFKDAQALARRARDAAPLDQSSWRLLLETLIVGSDALGAAAEAEHLDSLMAAEEIELEPATQAILRTARLSGTARTSEPAAEAQGLAPDLIGREREFSRLIAAWDAARTGRASTIVLSAPAGLGKTRLLRDLHSRLRASRARSASVRANPGDQFLVGGYLAAVSEAVARFPGAAAVSPGTASVLVGLSPALASVFPHAAPDAATGEDAVRRRTLALADLIRAVADESPLALLLDDLHWADDYSARVIAAAVARVADRGVLTVVATRSGETARGLMPAADEIRLLPLDLAQIGEFVSRLGVLPNDAWAAELPIQLLAATNGVPLHLVETLQHAIDDGTLRLSHGGWEVLAPDQLERRWHRGSAIRQRLAELDAPSFAVLLLLSAAGRPIAARAFGPGDRVAIDTLDTRGLLIRRDDMLLVAHDEIAATCIGIASEAAKRGAHARIARTVLDAGTDEQTLRVGGTHARESGDRHLLVVAWQRFVASRRRTGDRRSTRMVALDFLHEGADDPGLVVALVDAAPWTERRRTRWIAVALAAALVFAFVNSFVHAGARRSNARPDLRLGVSLDSGRSGGLELSASDRWPANEPIELSLADRSMPVPVPGLASSLAMRSPTGDLWMQTAVFPDSNEQDLNAYSPARKWYRPSRAVGDDGLGSFSPDGKFYAFSTARWDRATGHSSIAILDVATGYVRRVTGTAESDLNPLWSADGTRLAFLRRYYTQARALDVCIVTVDAQNIRCGGFPTPDVSFLAGWKDGDHLVTVDADSNVMRVVSTTGNGSQRLGVLPGLPLALAGNLLLCQCATGSAVERVLGVVRLDDVAEPRPITWHGRRVLSSTLFVAPAPDSNWLDRIRVIAPTASIPIDGVSQLRVEGTSIRGHALGVREVHWLALDSAIATVDTNGMVHPRRMGAARIVASAGGWRVDTVQVSIQSSNYKIVLTERWDGGWTRRWHPYGNPLPRIVGTDRGPAWIGNGDGSFGSGAYTRARFDATHGVGIDAVVRLKVTRYQWQTLGLALVLTNDESALKSWNHRDGPGPLEQIASSKCAIGFPNGEGGDGAKRLRMETSNGDFSAPTPKGLFDGSWHRVRLQLLADGRCALDLDGKSVLTAPSAIALSGRAMVRLTGDSVDGRLELGPLEIFEGARGAD